MPRKPADANTTFNNEAHPAGGDPVNTLSCGLTNRASAAGARFAGAPRARSFYATGQAHKRNSSLLGRARQLQALVRPRARSGAFSWAIGRFPGSVRALARHANARFR